LVSDRLIRFAAECFKLMNVPCHYPDHIMGRLRYFYRLRLPETYRQCQKFPAYQYSRQRNECEGRSANNPKDDKQHMYKKEKRIRKSEECHWPDVRWIHNGREIAE